MTPGKSKERCGGLGGTITDVKPFTMGHSCGFSPESRSSPVAVPVCSWESEGPLLFGRSRQEVGDWCVLQQQPCSGSQRADKEAMHPQLSPRLIRDRGCRIRLSGGLCKFH